jgi:DNA mismatch repair ATPase MutS
MASQPRARTPRDFVRRSDKARRKAKSERTRRIDIYGTEEKHVPTSKEVVDRALNSLSRLGSQRFAVAPFYEHFDRWLLSLRTVVSEFESSPALAVDDQFAKECSHVLSDIELALKERRIKEASRDEVIQKDNQNLLDARTLLSQTEREYAAKAKELVATKEQAVKTIASRVGKLRQELDRIVKIRAGFLRGISKKAKAQKEAEASQRLDSTKSELTKIERSFATQQEKLQQEYKERKRRILEQIANYEKEIENLEVGSQVDDALDARRSACDALINAVNAFLQRTQATSETTSPSP